eukprot:scaffold195043_cov50-Prasinocladus_malaysianus.AAC.1
MTTLQGPPSIVPLAEPKPPASAAATPKMMSLTSNELITPAATPVGPSIARSIDLLVMLAQSRKYYMHIICEDRLAQLRQ